jgi:hypothetical protein
MTTLTWRITNTDTNQHIVMMIPVTVKIIAAHQMIAIQIPSQAMMSLDIDTLRRKRSTVPHIKGNIAEIQERLARSCPGMLLTSNWIKAK